jgi:hypothetical protein
MFSANDSNIKHLSKESKIKQEVVEGGIKTIKNIVWRILAVFAASGLTVLGAGAVVGVDIWSAMLLAGILGVASVIERLARSFLEDGRLSIEDVNSAFAKTTKNPLK